MGEFRPEVREELSEANEEMFFTDTYDRALIGIVEGPGQVPVALYDRNVVLEILMEEEGLDEQSALEHFDYNIMGAYVGENTPLYATLTIQEDTYVKKTKVSQDRR